MRLMRHPTDTCQEARAMQIASLRQLGPSGRARLVAELSRRARELAEEGVRLRHPDWPPQRVRLETIRLTLGPTLFREAYGQRVSDDL
jgi:hypothetical protein